MKLSKQSYRSVLLPAVVLSMVAAGAMGCASSGKSGEQLSATGPTIINPRTSPETFQLNAQLYPQKPAQVLAEVKDVRAGVTDVKLRFVNVPYEIPMQRVGGTTWRAVLSADDLRELAVSGQTMKYKANVIARNDQGQVSVSPEPVEIRVKAEKATG